MPDQPLDDFDVGQRASEVMLARQFVQRAFACHAALLERDPSVGHVARRLHHAAPQVGGPDDAPGLARDKEIVDRGQGVAATDQQDEVLVAAVTGGGDRLGQHIAGQTVTALRAWTA